MPRTFHLERVVVREGGTFNEPNGSYSCWPDIAFFIIASTMSNGEIFYFKESGDHADWSTDRSKAFRIPTAEKAKKLFLHLKKAFGYRGSLHTEGINEC